MCTVLAHHHQSDCGVVKSLFIRWSTCIIPIHLWTLVTNSQKLLIWSLWNLIACMIPFMNYSAISSCWGWLEKQDGHLGFSKSQILLPLFLRKIVMKLGMHDPFILLTRHLVVRSQFRCWLEKQNGHQVFTHCKIPLFLLVERKFYWVFVKKSL